MQPLKDYYPSQVRDLTIVGGGVTGTAQAMMATSRHMKGFNTITLLEKNSAVAEVNSHPLNNAQSKHGGGIETNYGLDHAHDIQFQSGLLGSYVVKRAKERNDDGLYKRVPMMVFGYTADEVERLRQRYEDFHPTFPDLRLVERDELKEREENLILGRNESDPVVGLETTEGMMINYQRLAEHMLQDAIESDKDFQPLFNIEVEYKDIYVDENGIFILPTVEIIDGKKVKGIIRSKRVEFAAGAFSLLFAQALGEGKNFTIFPVAGSFIVSNKPMLNGKVYRVQIEGMPFAAIHGDPDILDPNVTRFGPSTKPLPLMERHHYDTMKAYFDTGVLSWKGILTILTILYNRQLLWYVFKNSLYDLPIIGMYLFLKEARTIIPNIKYSDLELRRGAGGIRPQVVNMDTRKLEMGDSCIVSHKLKFIANTTPSPGATISIGNSLRDIIQFCAFDNSDFDEPLTFDRAGFLADLGVEDREINHEVMVRAA